MVLYVTKPPLAPGECSNTRFTSDAPPAHRPILSASTYIATPSASPPPFLSLDVARVRPLDAAPPMPLFHVGTRARATVHHTPYPVFANGYRLFHFALRGPCVSRPLPGSCLQRPGSVIQRTI